MSNLKPINSKNPRLTFSKSSVTHEPLDLLNIQIQSFKEFVQEGVPAHKRKSTGLQKVFEDNFPITDSRETALLEFIEYTIEKPPYSIIECQEQGLTYSVPIKAKLRLSSKPTASAKEFTNHIEQEVYLGNLPNMTSRGSFIINGAERVIVSQLHRSPGVVFSESTHANGTQLYSARVIPYKGSWVEFTTDINELLYAYVDRKKKFYFSTLLKALGINEKVQMLELFGLVETVKINNNNYLDFVGRTTAEEIVNKETGDALDINENVELTEENLLDIAQAKLKEVKLIKSDLTDGEKVISFTIMKDDEEDEEYLEKEDSSATLSKSKSQVMMEAEGESAKSYIEKLFFNPKKYDLGDVGRYKINYKLGLKIAPEITILTLEDIVAIISYIRDLIDNEKGVDDIDHLGNRRVRTVKEQLGQQFGLGLSRMTRTIREKMSVHDEENFTPARLVSARPITSALASFFGTSQLSQFMDQTNPLSEMTHKRRISALGPGGLSRERAGFEVRDVHYTHYGRLCPIETPEGPNIGLISSLCIHSRINDFGFIETPYRKVVNGKVTNTIEYLSAEKEDFFRIAQANETVDEEGNFMNEKVKARYKGDFPLLSPDEIDYMDVATNQIVSSAAALIPFLEHDDANRALMGSNMQRQAVLLLKTEAPYVGTGFEEVVARDSRSMITAEADGVVESVSADKIVVRYNIKENSEESLLSFEDLQTVEYNLIKFLRTNQDTCINQKPIVTEGQKIKKGDILADGSSTQNGELALGKNVLVAFMPWHGFNYEDAIVISERIVSKDIFTSIHIEEYSLEVRDTKRGEEELTREIPNVADDAIGDLDDNGIVRIGADVKEGDILIGKVTPKGETEPTPEEKLLRAIFGDKAGDVKDASLKAPPGLKGIVINRKLFSRKTRDTEHKKEEKKRIDKYEASRKEEIKNLNRKLTEKLGILFESKTSTGIRDLKNNIILKSGVTIKRETFQDLLEKSNFNPANFEVEPNWTNDKKANSLAKDILKNYEYKLNEIEERYKRLKVKVTLGDELPTGVVKLAKVYVAKKRKLSVGDKMAGRHGNKGVVAKIVPVEDMPFMPDGTPVDIVLNPLGVPSRMNVGQLYETALGWVAAKLGVKFATPIFDGASVEQIQECLEQAGLPGNSRSNLFDGRTGVMFDQKVTVGYIYMLKLSHLVDDKIHARSIGPYSLITQQPLGGKAQFGGQRFGEMECWALQGYGAANILQEMLTVKSDDVNGRSKVFEAIVNGDNLPEPGVPEAFNVLMKEMKGLCLDVELED
ncbi:MAG: DNA-directed RNA polymerase subunit beta [Ignavibacteriaceae bacterium]|nr:MAG: DNA-directed RNA polymerase subunit beta [Chlorobiota bacterium]MBW7855007.1 DNA-directed RNA polymerase subunit beta [Ignavibacteria bacterium]MCC6886322.1 DNA-directed RNA polymerase subunit beta [Ignavibacteriales bacterium]MCE7953761.1 DNA-directed RNA polymerase subunit beta [Chlorobi bacterium CHB7]MDL1887695.1 DNA-directed RNA polymerase subunit beta [Ignavibacteria bacterium CHB1]MEB2330306.1 DNA-directed RNA polymerase subunit beta [Ignavibacteriaceae bacterium]OQY76808.1 MAG